MTTYADFSIQESLELKNIIEKESEAVVLVSYDFKLSVYPKDESSLKELADHRERIVFYRLNQGMDEMYGYKPSVNMSVIELAWTIKFKDSGETVIAFKDGKSESRASEITIEGKTFKKLENRILTVLTINKETNNKRINVINAHEGAVIYSRNITDISNIRNPIMDVYENLVLLNLPNEKGDEILLIEMLIAPEIAQSESSSVGKASLSSLLYSLVTNVKCNEQIKGMKIVNSKGVEKLVTITKDHEVIVVELQKLNRGQMNEIQKGKTNTLPKDLRFRYPILLQYNNQKDSLLAYNLDVHELELE